MWTELLYIQAYIYITFLVLFLSSFCCIFFFFFVGLHFLVKSMFEFLFKLKVFMSYLLYLHSVISGGVRHSLWAFTRTGGSQEAMRHVIQRYFLILASLLTQPQPYQSCIKSMLMLTQQSLLLLLHCSCVSEVSINHNHLSKMHLQNNTHYRPISFLGFKYWKE